MSVLCYVRWHDLLYINRWVCRILPGLKGIEYVPDRGFKNLGICGLLSTYAVVCEGYLYRGGVNEANKTADIDSNAAKVRNANL